jgi:hypothetical protein
MKIQIQTILIPIGFYLFFTVHATENLIVIETNFNQKYSFPGSNVIPGIMDGHCSSDMCCQESPIIQTMQTGKSFQAKEDPMPESEIEPVDPDASANTRDLLKYLDGLKHNGNNRRVLSGTSLTIELDLAYNIYVEGTYNKVGVYPAIIQPSIFDHWSDRGNIKSHRSSSWIIPGTYNWVKDGGLIWWLYNPNNPFTGEKHLTFIPDGHHISEVWTEGTEAYDIFHEDLEILALQLKALAVYDIPVVIRMIGECDLNKIQWTNPKRNNHNWDDFRKFWRHTTEYMRNELDVHNVLWCLEGVGNNITEYWQEDYIDIAGIQETVHAGPYSSASPPYSIFTSSPVNTLKPIIYGQYLVKAFKDELPSYHYSWATRLFKEHETRLVGCIPWDGNRKDPPTVSHSPIHHYDAKEYYTDSVMINRGDNQTFGTVTAPYKDFQYTLPLDSISGIGLNFNFNSNNNSEGWMTEKIQKSRVVDNVFHLFYFGKDPVIRLPGLNAEANSFCSAAIRIRNNSLADVIKFEWQKDGETFWHSVDVKIAQVPAYFEVLEIDLSGCSNWSGTIDQVRLRLNPDHKWGSSEIDYIQFVSLPSLPVNTPQENSVFKVGQDVLMEVDASGFDDTLKQIEFYLDGYEYAIDSVAPYEVIFTDLSAGKHSLAAKVIKANEIVALGSVKIQVNFKANNPNVTPEAQNLLNYLYNLGRFDATEKKIISGHWIGSSHATGYSTSHEVTLEEVDFFYEQTGKSVGIVDVWICPGWGVLDDPINKGMWYDNIIRYQTQWYKAGGLIHAGHCPWCPLDTKYESRHYDGDDIPSAEHILTRGTGANMRWMAMLDKMVKYFKAMQEENIPVVFRPFSEHYGNWRWFGPDTFSPNDFRKLWHHMYHYYTDTIGLNNILWEFNEAKTHPQYPGDEYVDLFASQSIYSFNKYLTKTYTRSSDEGIWSVGELGQGRNGPNEKADYNAWINLQMEAAPYTTSFITWSGCAGPFGCGDRPYNITFNEALKNTWVINRDEINFNTNIDNSPPTSPSNFRAEYQYPGKVLLRWNQSTDNESEVYRYFVYRDDSIIAKVSGDSLQYIDTGLNYGTEYIYSVSAENFVRLESKKSNETGITTSSHPDSKGLLQLKNVDGSWIWINEEAAFIANIGFQTQLGNITIDTTSTDAILISSVYTGTSNILKIGGENNGNLPETAWFGAGNSNPVLRIIYKTAENVQGTISATINFDSSTEELNKTVVFNSSDGWDTLIVRLNTIQKYQPNAKDLTLNNFRIFYPTTLSNRLSLEIKEVAYGAEDLIRDSDILTGIKHFAQTGKSGLNIYPNPAFNSITVDLPDAKIRRLFLYNNMGACMKELNVYQGANKVKLNVRDYNSGIYYIRAETNGKQSSDSYNSVFLKN